MRWGEIETTPPIPSGLSTLPEGHESRLLELAILGQLKNHFFLENASSWKWGFASSDHHGHAFHAVDLNHYDSHGIPDDDGALVKSPARGRVVFNQRVSCGTTARVTALILEHPVDVGGSTKYWYSKYLHMYADSSVEGRVGPRTGTGGAVTGLAPSSDRDTFDINEGASIGHVGNDGSPVCSSGSHMHTEIIYAPDGRRLAAGVYITEDAMDLRQLLSNPDLGFGMSVSATAYHPSADGPTLGVRWDPTISAWSSITGYLVYDRSEQESTSGTSSYWKAYERGRSAETMERVIFGRYRHRDETGGISERDAWVKMTDEFSLWDSRETERRFLEWEPLEKRVWSSEREEFIWIPVQRP